MRPIDESYFFLGISFTKAWTCLVISMIQGVSQLKEILHYSIPELCSPMLYCVLYSCDEKGVSKKESLETRGTRSEQERIIREQRNKD